MPHYNGVTLDNRISLDPTGPYPYLFATYGASKVLAFNSTLDFIVKENPTFTLFNDRASVRSG